jgi:hypothetical protein
MHYNFEGFKMKKALLTKMQVSALNNESELGVLKNRYVHDYPVLHQYLANVFSAAHLQIMSGNHVKHGFSEPEIITSDQDLQAKCPDYWLSKLGNYVIEEVFATAYYKKDQSPHTIHCIALTLKCQDDTDVFIYGKYLLYTNENLFNIYVKDNGTLSDIEMSFDETQPPSYLKELVRDVPMSIFEASREELLQKIKDVGCRPDEVVLGPVHFGAPITIELED